MLRIVVATAALLLAAAQARADPVADFYKGQQVKLIVGYGTGGGYDVYGRLFARHLGRHIPGQPNVIVQNMPGAGIAARRQFPRQHRAQGRHRHRDLLARHAAARDHRPQRQCAVRCARAHLARLVVELRQRRLLPVRAQGRQGAVDRRCAPRRRATARPRRHRRGRDRQRRGDGVAQRAWPQPPSHPRLSGFRRAVPRGRSPRSRRPLRRAVGDRVVASELARAGEPHADAVAVRARDAPPGLSRGTDRTRARARRQDARADRARRIAVPAVAAVRRTARRSAGARAGAAGGVPCSAQRSRPTARTPRG